MENNTIISLENVNKTFGKDENAVVALNNVSFTINKGEFVAITGESGSGKSTLLSVIGSLDKADSGKIIVNGQSISEQKDEELAIYRRRNIGFIFQFFNLIPVLNIEENIMLPINLDGLKPDEKYLEELLEITGLTSKRYNFPHELSGGQQQRVSVARALIHKPPVILADEPTGNLDSKNSREVITMLKNSVKKYGQTLVVITHDGNIASQADRIFTMCDGVLTEKEGTL
ncbi:MAG: ABC transporter ATP-binding protein [Ruminococcus sp.]|jgi:putative ABC transport system ATP-binding protein|nr:ABC transporter ATP-binding protein [Ruminococcus sp.]MBQ7010012.1 ABC transporter ATP-binding protein [Ruminococcus sp.]MBR4023120.1 ABC transporter ATP-binding protein [Ruminococcus sp.]MBR6670257.1 ABC transporter ATP-binding protein [Ruminococcus sp.]